MLLIGVEGSLAGAQTALCPASLASQDPREEAVPTVVRQQVIGEQLEGTRETSCSPVTLAMKIYSLPVRILIPYSLRVFSYKNEVPELKS